MDFFSYTEFRCDQKEVINKIQKLFESGIEVVILEGPTGFGKSPVNIALGRYFAPSYYTTPQTKLVKQLKEFCPRDSEGNEVLCINGGKGEIIALDARKKYVCKATGLDSEACKEFRCLWEKCIYYDTEKQKCEYEQCLIKEESCVKEPKCTYWAQKEGVFKSDIGITTFANLIVNSYLPPYVKSESEQIQIAFLNRNLLIIDECHSLEEQVASLFAGFVISPKKFDLNNDWRELSLYLPRKIDNIDNLKEFIAKAKDKAIELKKNKDGSLEKKEVSKLENLVRQINNMELELEEGRKWVVNEQVDYNRNRYPQFKPILVDKFLQNHIWRYGKKILLTSATIPYASNVKKWLERIGLGDKRFECIKIPMRFPVCNRPIITSTMRGKMTRAEIERSWEGNVKTIKEILTKHKSEKGLIHTNSFELMWKLYEELRFEFSVYPHDKKKLEQGYKKGEKKEIIETWIRSGKKVLLSPSSYEGIDLKDDLCRFQILLKVPYAFMGDKRVNYFVQEKKDWEWYSNEAMIKVVQAYGRAVRHDKDWAKFYIIDGSFPNLYSKFPEWFMEAITRENPK